MSQEQKVRLWQSLKPMLFFAGLGFFYFIWLKITGIGIPCAFRLMTGFQCPGCGITRMVMAVLRFDFKAAWSYNGAALICFPLLSLVYVYETYGYIRYGAVKKNLWSKIVLIVCGIVLLTHGVVRNF